jgi:hypothetical protein
MSIAEAKPVNVSIVQVQPAFAQVVSVAAPKQFSE